MKSADFLYHRPTSVEDAVRLLDEYDGGARILAGGQSLMPMLNMRLLRPRAVIDINRIEGLDRIEALPSGETLLGARLRYHQIEESALIARRLPLLLEVVTHVGDRQVRNRGTLGGSLVQADPAGNLPLAALALSARLRLRSRRGTREVHVEGFFQGAYATALEPDEILVEVVFPPHPAHAAFMEVARRHNDFAVLAIAVVGERGEGGRWTGLRIGLGALHDMPVLARGAMAAVEGSNLSDAAIDGAAEAVLGDIRPQSDMRASAEYRRHLTPIHLRRMLARLRESAPVVAASAGPVR
jgi:carbon-monoxide dehydrogenase medium subunit